LIFYAPLSNMCCLQYASEELLAGTDYKMYTLPSGNNARVLRIYASNISSTKADLSLYDGDPAGGGSLKLKIVLPANGSIDLSDIALLFENDIYARTSVDTVYLLLSALFVPK